MGIITILLIAIGLSFDTFAVSISSGLTINTIRFLEAVRIAFVLAFFQAFMPFIGWLGGIQIVKYIKDYDHWIAFGLLSLLGLKMIRESLNDDNEDKKFNPLRIRVMLWMAIATSIDALVAGFSFAFIDMNIYLACFIIGAITFIMAMIGMLIGKKIGTRLGRKMEFFGGLILVGLGIKILVVHLIG